MQSITGAQLVINNEVIPYQPNSLKFDMGRPERSVAPQVAGDGRVVNITSENFETAKGKVMFDLKSTSENEETVLDWQLNLDSNVIKVITKDGKARVFEQSVVINKPEIDTGTDGVISLEWESAQGVFG